MNKINHPILIVSTASAIIIIGASIALGLRFGIAIGLLTGVSAFTVLITGMLFANRWLNRTNPKKQKAKTRQKKK